MNFVEHLFEHLKAGYPAIQIDSAEETRACLQIREACWKMGHGRQLDLSEEDGTIEELLSLTKTQSHQHAFQSIVKSYLKETFGVPKEAQEMLLDSPPRCHADTLIRICHWLYSNERDLEGEFIAECLSSTGYQMMTYDTVGGFEGAAERHEDDVYGALAATLSEDFASNCVFVFKDIEAHLNDDQDPRYRRMLRHIVEPNLLAAGGNRRFLLFLQPSWRPHASLQHLLARLDFDLPDEEQLGEEVDFIASSIQTEGGETLKCNTDLKHQLVQAMRGFTQTEAANVLSHCAVRHGGFTPDMLQTVNDRKAMMFKNDDVLEFIAADRLAASNEIGGYENYLEFIDECRECYGIEATKMGLKHPKGVLLLGIPGTGKSMVAKATSRRMSLPLLIYNFAQVFAGVVGESEGRQDRALKRIRAQGRCVVLIDEADKAFGGIVGSSGDSGVGQRVFGRLLSWMANENDDAFVVMTMNRLVDPDTGAVIVPIETIRAGRLDATFYTDFPNPVEREEILSIHMIANGADWSEIDEKSRRKLIDGTENYVGSELEQLCIKSVRTAFSRRRVLQPTGQEMLDTRSLVSPIAVLDHRNVSKINEFCKDRAIPVTKPKDKAAKFGRRPKRGINMGNDN